MFPRAQLHLYGLLLGVRLLFSLLPGYIQPDEFFQSPEITAGSAFDIEIFTPWEFDPASPARSIVPPLLTTGIPFYWYKLARRLLLDDSGQEVVSSRHLFIVQRLSFFLMSILLDLSIARLSRVCKINASRPLLLLSSSYVMLTYQCHSFSNSVEAVALALSITKLFGTDQSASFFLGIILAFGLFTRITFALFGAPIGIAYLYMSWQKTSSARLVPSRIPTFITQIAPFAFGLTSSVALFTVIDSIYFGSLTITLPDSNSGTLDILYAVLHPALWPHLQVQGKLISTIINNLLYNVDKDNLQLHGLHPYYLHTAVNVPLLFGPIGLWLYWRFANALSKGVFAKNDQLDNVLVATIVTGLLGLSAFPHQEARFLTPILLPAVVLFARHITRIPRSFWFLWIIFNSVLALTFGWVHQGGVVPAVIYVGHQSKLTRECDITPGRYAICSTTQGSSLTGTPGTGPPFITNVIFYKTYMPPRHLLAYPKKLRDLSDVIINVTDLAGTSIQNASTLIQSQMHIPASLVPADTMSKIIFSYNASNTAYERYPFPTARSSATASKCTTQQVSLTAISPEQNASHHARHGNSTG